MKRTRKKHNAVIKAKGSWWRRSGGTGRSPSWRVSSAFIRTGSTTGRSSCWTGRRAFSKAAVARACWERGGSKSVVLLTGTDGSKSISLQQGVYCEPKADRWLQDPSHANLKGGQLAGALEGDVDPASSR